MTPTVDRLPIFYIIIYNYSTNLDLCVTIHLCSPSTIDLLSPSFFVHHQFFSYIFCRLSIFVPPSTIVQIISIACTLRMKTLAIGTCRISCSEIRHKELGMAPHFRIHMCVRLYSSRKVSTRLSSRSWTRLSQPLIANTVDTKQLAALLALIARRLSVQ